MSEKRFATLFKLNISLNMLMFWKVASANFKIQKNFLYLVTLNFRKLTKRGAKKGLSQKQSKKKKKQEENFPYKIVLIAQTIGHYKWVNCKLNHHWNFKSYIHYILNLVIGGHKSVNR